MFGVFIAALLLSGDFCLCQSPDADSAARFENATSIALDPGGDIYVLDGGKNMLIQLSAQQTGKRASGGYGWSDVAFDQPKDVVAPNGLDIYVADYGNHRIQRLDRNLNFVSAIPAAGNQTEPAFRYPMSVAVSRQGALFITDGENGRILKYVNNVLERTFGDVGGGAARLRQPSRVRISDKDIVYVQDRNLLVRYDYFGNYLSPFGPGALRKLIAFTLDHRKVYAVDSSAVYAFNSNGMLDWSLPLDSLMTSTEGEAPVDIALSKDTLYLLTPHRLIAHPVVGGSKRK